MPLIKSAKKRVRSNQRKQAVNQLQRIGAKTAVRTAYRAISNEAADAAQISRTAVSRLDRAAQKGIIHKNKAARLKSRLAAKLKNADITVGAKPTAKPKTTSTKPAASKTTAAKSPAKKTSKAKK